MGLLSRIDKFLRPHKGMEQVMIHDDCGGWMYFVEYNCGHQVKCDKCGKSWETYWHMGEQPHYHLEWKPKVEVDKFYG